MESQAERWAAARIDWVDTGWFDWEGRPKTLSALKKLVGALPQEDLELIEERSVLVFAPDPGKSGETKPRYSPPSRVGIKGVFVYLSPDLETEDQPRVDSIVAHEFAHVILHPFESASPPSIEREADRKIGDWGFAPAYTEELYQD